VNLDRFDLNLLVAFEALITEEQVTRAARRACPLHRARAARIHPFMSVLARHGRHGCCPRVCGPTA